MKKLIITKVTISMIFNEKQKENKIMIYTDSDKVALHYKVIADTAHKIEKVSEELSALYTDSSFNEKRVNLRKEHLKKYIEEFEKLLNEN